MDLLSSIALYFVLWWLCLFISLPIGVRAAHEEGEEVQIGNEPGAPVKPKLWFKMAFATVIAFVLLMLLQWGLSAQWLQDYWA